VVGIPRALLLAMVIGCGARAAEPHASDTRGDEQATYACAAGKREICERLARDHARACDAGDMAGCAELGALYADGRIAGKSAADAVPYLERACARRHGAGCTRRGELQARAIGSPPDLERAAGLYQRGCDLGDARGCVLRARALEWGRGVGRDAKAAVKLLERACKADDAEGCVELGRATEHGVAGAPDPLVAFDRYRKAARLYEARCEKGDAAGCAGLGMLTREGSGVEEDREGGLSLLDRACRARHAPACAAWMQRDERWVDNAAARAVLDEACKRGEGVSCLVLARVTPREDVLKSGCDSGHGGSCNALAITQFPPDFALLERACALGDAPGCFHLALALELPGERQNTERAAALHERSCRWRWGAGCTRFGRLLASGEGVAVDAELAARVFRDGCELGSAAGCFELGVMREEGTRVSGDPAQAVRLLERACRNGEGDGCARLARRVEPAFKTPLLAGACESGHARSCIELAPVSDEARALERARASALPACEAALAFCHDKGKVTPKLGWQKWAGAPARVWWDPPACDERLERACLDASDALSLSCRRVTGAQCFAAARLLQRLARAGLGPERAQIDELVRLATDDAQKGCKRKDEAACARLCELDKRYCR